MNKQTLEHALEQIDDRHIARAAAPRPRKRLPRLLAAAAAVLALVLVARHVEIPMLIRAKAVASAAGSQLGPRPDIDDYTDRQAFHTDWDQWMAQQDALYHRAAQANAAMLPFLEESCRIFLAGEENALYSPINAYLGLAMTTELTAGETRQQVLDALGAADTAQLRSYVSALWETAYRDNGNEISTLANSLWMHRGIGYRQEAMDILGSDYHCWVYQRDLTAKASAKDIAAWVNNHTGGMLRSYTQGISLPPDPVLALYSTVYFQSKWTEEFRASNNTQAPFHAPQGDITATFMRQKQRQMYYYWGDSFGAVALGLKNGSRMWLILPDEGKTPADVLAQGQYLRLATADYENSKYMKVNLSVPKFDIAAQTDLRSGLEAMGITDLFSMERADFSAGLDTPAYLTAANQAVRVQVDEQGVKAAAYLELPAAGAAEPPEEIIDFVLDRPFLFLITGPGDQVLFAGTVNQP